MIKNELTLEPKSNLEKPFNLTLMFMQYGRKQGET